MRIATRQSQYPSTKISSRCDHCERRINTMQKTDRSRHINEVFSLAGQNLTPTIVSKPNITVLSSWKRCIEDYGMKPETQYSVNVHIQKNLREHQGPLGEFMLLARAGMVSLQRHLSKSHYKVILSDSLGVNIDLLADQSPTHEDQRAGLCLGAIWTEEQCGTNAIGICIKEKQPQIIYRNEHFLADNIDFTCVAAPIFSPYGDLLATLAAASNCPSLSRESQFPIVQLVTSYATLIEKSNFLKSFERCWILRLNSCEEFANIIAESILAINDDGLIVAADQTGQCLLAEEFNNKLKNLLITDILDISLDELKSKCTAVADLHWPVRSHSGAQYFATLKGPKDKIISVTREPEKPKLQKRTSRTSNTVLSLEDLAGSDPQMAFNIKCAMRVMNKKLPILLSGETGTGKEVFAKAIHLASNRAEKPFVAVNCASIPESLIESELFGYEPGAFTGARSKGMRGKILQSDGGTLFLDEIGDMPQEAQTRLLRVLAENEVSPLGGDFTISVDLNVICATHRNLEDLVEKGIFREDLYYRLNGVKLSMPSLRERSDKEKVIYAVLALEAGNGYNEISLGKETLEVLMKHPLPGNIRQLRNAFRFALAINDCGIISPSDLPPDISSSKTYPQDAQPQTCKGFPRQNIMENAEQEIILASLERYKWSITDAANELGMSRATLYKKMEKYNFTPPNKR